jgi:hypothetical protein
LGLRPDRIIVQREGQPEEQIALGDREGAAYRGMLAIAAGVMAASIAFSVMMRLLRRG